MSEVVQEYNSFKEFYPFYLSEHSNTVCRRLHYAASLSVLSFLSYCLVTQQYAQLIWLPLIGYGPAWVGHFIFEKNRPATFKYPLYSFLGDWVMLKDGLLGKIK